MVLSKDKFQEKDHWRIQDSSKGVVSAIFANFPKNLRENDEIWAWASLCATFWIRQWIPTLNIPDKI